MNKKPTHRKYLGPLDVDLIKSLDGIKNQSHTPTPWRIGDAGHTIFGPKTDRPSPLIVAANLSREDAALAARAVNSFEELLDLARWVKESLRPDERPANVDALIKKAEGK